MSIFCELGLKGSVIPKKEEFLYNLVACHSLIESDIQKVLAPYGLSPVKINALLILKHIGGRKGLLQKDLCSRLIVTAGNVTRLIDRLEADGLVLRQVDEDKRANRISVTQKGSKLLDKAWKPYKARVEQLIGLMDAADIQAGTKSLDLLRTKLLARIDCLEKEEASE